MQETLSRDDNSEASFGSSFGGATILHRPWTSAPPRCVTASGAYPRSVLYEDEGASWDSVLDDVLDDACVPRSAHVPAAHGMGAARVPFSSRRVECDADDEGSGSSSEFATDGGEGVHIPAANGRALRDRLQALGLSGSDVMGLSLLSSRR
ncbi:hypothetical protein EON66_08040 [archaeon]|nr:MAG: hypothetical protein EON66_08040 [archaeon]